MGQLSKKEKGFVSEIKARVTKTAGDAAGA